MRKEISECMSELSQSDQTLTAAFVFPESFSGFQGHFPSKKILPGVCQIQCVLAMLEKWKNRTTHLKEISISKFLSPALPNERISCVCSELTDVKQEFTVKAVISKGGQKISELKLKVFYGN